MSKYVELRVLDTDPEYEIYSTKATNLQYIRLRFLKRLDPTGTMKLEIWNETKTVKIATSNTLNTNYSTNTEYVGTDNDYNMSWIRFDFNGEAIRKNVNYVLKVVFNSAYYTGVTANTFISLLFDYPKPTNDKTLIESTNGRDFTKYPSMVIQMFGKD